MAEITTAGKPGKRKKATPRIDLTPMVDLGFLLITFFMFTTTLAQKRALQLNMPTSENTDTRTAYPEEATITVIPVHDHKIAWYYGTLNDAGNVKMASLPELRGLLTDRKAYVAALPAGLSAAAHKLHVVIKPNSDCTYSDVVNVLDEMEINDVAYYAIADITNEEKDAVKK